MEKITEYDATATTERKLIDKIFLIQKLESYDYRELEAEFFNFLK